MGARVPTRNKACWLLISNGMYIPLEEGEEILTKVHRHWIFIALRVLLLGLLLIAPVILVPLIASIGVFTVVTPGAGALIALWSLWALVCWAIFWQFWTTYYMDIWIVTNHRLIDIDYQRLFDREISILRLDRVQDITTRVQGVFGTVLKYGSVVVQTAGTSEEFVIDQIANPEALRDSISHVVSELARRPQSVRLEQ